MTVFDKQTVVYDTGSGSPSYPLEMSQFRSIFTLSGEFAVHVHFSISIDTGATAGNHSGVWIRRESDLRVLGGSGRVHAGQLRYEAWTDRQLVQDSVVSEQTPTSGWYRIIRDATNQFYVFYWGEEAKWEWDGDENGLLLLNDVGGPHIDDADVKIELHLQQGNGPGWHCILSNLEIEN
jgi:hypothetical protein